MPKLGMEEVEGALDPAPELDETIELSIREVLPKGYLSVSQLTTFLKCPHQWYLRYVKGLPTRTAFRMFQGIQVHKAVETLLEGRLRTGSLPPLSEATDVFSTAFEEQKPLIDDWEGKDPGAAKDEGVTLTKEFFVEAAPKATPVMVESSFLTQLTSSKPGGDISKIPLFGRIDSVQVAAFTEKEYQKLREEAVKQLDEQEARGVKYPAPPKLGKPIRIHDLKVCSKKWSQSKLDNDAQMTIYSGVLGIPDVQVDQIVKGQSKDPMKKIRARYEVAQTTVPAGRFEHLSRVASGVVDQIAAGAFENSYTDPGNWWCSAQWCSMWSHCRGKLETQLNAVDSDGESL